MPAIIQEIALKLKLRAVQLAKHLVSGRIGFATIHGAGSRIPFKGKKADAEIKLSAVDPSFSINYIQINRKKYLYKKNTILLVAFLTNQINKEDNEWP